MCTLLTKKVGMMTITVDMGLGAVRFKQSLGYKIQETLIFRRFLVYQIIFAI